MEKTSFDVQQILRLKRALTHATLEIAKSQEIPCAEGQMAKEALFSACASVGVVQPTLKECLVDLNSAALLAGIPNKEVRQSTGRLLGRHRWHTLHRFGSAKEEVIKDAFMVAGLEIPVIVKFFHEEYAKLLAEEAQEANEAQAALCAA